METSIQTFIKICQWDTSRFLVFSDNVFDSLIYYSHLVPLIISLILAIFIFKASYRLLVSKVLFSTILLLGFWLFADSILWATNNPKITMFFWSLINMVEPMIYAGILYFLYLFINERDISFYKKVFIMALLLPTIILTSTKFSLSGFDLTNCFRDAIEGSLIYYNYFIEILFIFWILFFTIKRFFTAKDKDSKRKILYITLGSLGFLITFAFGNVIGSLFDSYGIAGDYSWTVGQYGIFGVPVFLGFLTYMIVKFNIFNIKLLATQALVWGLVALIGSQFFFIKVTTNFILNGITFVGIIIFGQFLIKSVKKEIQQKEELAKLNINLEELLKQRESLVHLVTHKVKGSFTRSKYIFAGMLDGMFGEINDEIKKRAEQGLESDNMGIETVDLVLNAANLEKGLIKYEMKPVDFKDLVEKSVDEKKISVEAKGLKMETEIKDGVYNTLGDAMWLKEVVNNLIENSIKYTREGKITVGLERKENKILFYVKDTGIGVSEEDKKSLFTEGGRGKDSVKVNVDSTGYGLYSVRLIVQEHKGKVWMEANKEGVGSVFFVELDAD
ncbi:MAG: HAMP domain-containing sensor histidine kinase [Candidatus Paceibacterota bacterium]